MAKLKVARYFQVIKIVSRRDGLHLSAVGDLFESLSAAMAEANRLDRSTPAWVAYQTRGLQAGEPESLEGFTPRIRDRRPVKLYAVKASPYPQGREPEGFVVPWFTAWGRSATEARGCFLHSAREYNAYHVHRLVELTAEQENKIQATENKAERLRLARSYGEEAPV